MVAKKLVVVAFDAMKFVVEAFDDVILVIVPDATERSVMVVVARFVVPFTVS